jgi:hypothetical protein
MTILLPLHSMSAFTIGVLLSEHYNLLPSFVLFAISWLLFASSGSLSNNPSPWQKPIPFFQLSQALFLGELDSMTIESFQNKAEIEEYEARQQAFQKQLEEEARKAAELKSLDKTDAELAAMNETEEVEMATNKEFDKGGIHLNPLEPILFPVQQNLHKVCVYLRIARSLVTWQEPLYAFWLCLSCLAAGIVFLFIPWAFITRWAIRIVVWTFLGPWMKLVDIAYVQRQESQEVEATALRKKLKELRGTATSRQIKRENMTKVRNEEQFACCYSVYHHFNACSQPIPFIVLLLWFVALTLLVCS